MHRDDAARHYSAGHNDLACTTARGMMTRSRITGQATTPAAAPSATAPRTARVAFVWYSFQVLSDQ
jgi:hypothetical protein